MKKTQNRTQMMLHEPIRKVVPKLAVPTIITMLITNIYNMADTYFVSQLGTSASGAVGVIFSAMTFMQAVAFTVGMGSGANVSQALGAGDEDKAKQFVATGFFTTFFLGILIAVIALTNIDPLMRLLGATETILPYARDYGTYIFYAAPFLMSSFAMNNLLRFEGMAFYGMIGIGFGSILNIVLDPVFIFVLDMGTSGAAIATALSQMISFCILLYLTNRKAGAIAIHPGNCRFSAAVLGKIFYVGLPSMGRQGIASLSSIILNHTAGVYGDAAIAAISIVNRFVMFINASVIGFGQGFQPVCGFCYGARKFSRVRESFRFSVKVTTVILIVLSAAAMCFSEEIVTLFRKDDPEVIRIGTLALRLQLCSMPLWGFITMSNMFTQSIGYGVRATIISSARQGLFLIPALLILPAMFGLTGIQMAQPVSDVLTFALSLIIVSGILKQLKSLPDAVPET